MGDRANPGNLCKTKGERDPEMHQTQKGKQWAAAVYVGVMQTFTK
jgi:hypothetical protein